MKAIRFHRYGGPEQLRLEEVEPPRLEADDQVLVRVRAASVNPLDWHMLRGEPWFVRTETGLLRPKEGRLGADLAGVVEAVGAGVTRFSPGDEVFGNSVRTLAEVVRVTEEAIVDKPENVSFEEAAGVGVAGLTALQGLRDKARLQPGERVLVNGASGGVGTFAVQLAKVLGAEVTGVCSTRNVELVRGLGADLVVDYTREDFAARGERYDVIVEAVANRPLSALRRVLAPGGRIAWVGAAHGRLGGKPVLRFAQAIAARRLRGLDVVPFLAKRTVADLELLRDLLADGRIRTVVDRSYPLEETADAIRYLETFRARGKVVITL
jgi:NADPH:quinone reductase-like Zn-dependent oxidoreductase